MVIPGASKRYVVTLSADERAALETILARGTVAAQKRRHASILLAVDEGKYGPAMSDGEAAEDIGVGLPSESWTPPQLVSQFAGKC